MKKEGKDLVKSLTSTEQIKLQIKFLEDNNIFYKMKLTNYTTSIETPSQIFKWNNNNMSKKAFIAYQMILRDLKEYTANERPDTLNNNLEYFNTNIEGVINQPEVFCIDIKSAYASVLLNDGFISDRTFQFINILPKKSRLAAVGMLASRNDLFYFQGRELTGHQKNVNVNENYFWYCVQRTADLMNLIKAQTDYLFFWVDGIYFLTQKDADTAKKILTDEKYLFTEKKCLMFQAQTIDRPAGKMNKISFYECKNLSLKYEDAKKEDVEYKVFSIPLRRKIKNEIIEYLIKNY